MKSFKIIGKTFAGLEKALAGELTDIGVKHIKILQRGVEFEGNMKTLYKVNYLCRSALRFIMPVATFAAPDENQLYEQVKKIPWFDFLDISASFSIDGITSYSNINHSKYMALKSKDAIVDKFREKFGRRPNVQKVDPDLKINVRLFKNMCTVSLDSSGESLHKRGYRVATGPAPLNEVLAAGLILLTGWKGDTNFIDPMCGSGTLPIEAAMINQQIPPGFFRENFAFQKWTNFDSYLWEKVKSEAEKQRKSPGCEIIGSDWSGRIIQTAKQNVESAGLTDVIRLKVDFMKDFEPPEGPGVCVTNPPYGERIKTDDINKLYREIGDTLKQRFKNYTVWIISSHDEAVKHIGLRASEKYAVFNGALPCKYLGFEMYEGSRKKKHVPAESDNSWKSRKKTYKQKSKHRGQSTLNKGTHLPGKRINQKRHE